MEFPNFHFGVEHLAKIDEEKDSPLWYWGILLLFVSYATLIRYRTLKRKSLAGGFDYFTEMLSSGFVSFAIYLGLKDSGLQIEYLTILCGFGALQGAKGVILLDILVKNILKKVTGLDFTKDEITYPFDKDVGKGASIEENIKIDTGDK